MEVGGRLHAPDILLPGKEIPDACWIGTWLGSRQRVCPRRVIPTYKVFFIFVFLEICEQERENSRSNEQIRLAMCV